MGQMVEHPMASHLPQSVTAYLRIATEFGLTASAAMRVAVAYGEPEPFAEIGESPRLRRVK